MPLFLLHSKWKTEFTWCKHFKFPSFFPLLQHNNYYLTKVYLCYNSVTYISKYEPIVYNYKYYSVKERLHPTFCNKYYSVKERLHPTFCKTWGSVSGVFSRKTNNADMLDSRHDRIRGSCRECNVRIKANIQHIKGYRGGHVKEFCFLFHDNFHPSIHK